MSKQLMPCAAAVCLLLLSACASPHKSSSSSAAIMPAPVATRSAGGDVTVYSLDNGEPVTATPAVPLIAPLQPYNAAPPSAATQSPSIKHKFFSWFHGSNNDTQAVTPAPAPLPAETSVDVPPPDSKADAQILPPPPRKSARSAADGPVAPSDIDDAAPPPSDAPPAGGRMLTGKSSRLEPQAPKTDDVASDADALPPAQVGEPVRVYFRHNDAKLTARDTEAVRQLAGAQAGLHLPLQVEGHASVVARTSDPVRRAIINLKVAMDRALSVTNALIRDGVPAAAIQTIAFGDTRPSLAIDGKSEEDASRRVEIYTVNSRATDVVSTF